MSSRVDILDYVAGLKAAGKPFALATVIRTVSVTAAKAGAKAVIHQDGSISEGWIGGGCARAAVLKAARLALSDGQPKMVSIQPEDLLKDSGVEAGEERAGIRYAKNMCPSKGTMDIFVEPVLPKPMLLVCGASPVAVAMADMGTKYDFDCRVFAAPESRNAFPGQCRFLDEVDASLCDGREVYAVVSTQGSGDEKNLAAVLALDCAYVGFVGSRKKAEALRAKLSEKGVAGEKLNAVVAPAGLDIGAILPEEIALSILAQIVQRRRQGQRTTPSSTIAGT
ncbi:XdhC family protein [Hwanghaeella sp.]|uniref:XdhC family protein n=1 Tax=Hwanghaeella sp. TaxID=2605943 RepID=UPI003CCBB4E5